MSRKLAITVFTKTSGSDVTKSQHFTLFSLQACLGIAFITVSHDGKLLHLCLYVTTKTEHISVFFMISGCSYCGLLDRELSREFSLSERQNELDHGKKIQLTDLKVK